MSYYEQTRGSVNSEAVTDDVRRRVLIEEFGMSEEIVARLPEAPPGSRTAAALTESR